MMELAFFGFFSVVALAAAISVILQKNPVYSALSLIIVIASMGGLFLLLQATFLAVLQIIIYAGAVMALFLFVIMMVEVPQDLSPTWNSRATFALILLLLIAGSCIWAISASPWTFSTLASDFSVRSLATQLFTTYLFPFEAIALLIVSSVIGALYIARKEQ